MISSIKNIFTHEKAKLDIALACRMIAMLGLDSGPFGNISIRVPNTQTLWINPIGVTFDQITPEQMVCIDVDGNLLTGNIDAHPGAFIHREIYRLRDDVSAIVHTHAEHSSALSLLDCTIEPFTQLGASLYQDQGLYHGFSGPVRTTEEGYDIAQALGKNAIVIAKNHGLFATGQTIQGTLWDMVVAEMAAKQHLTARQLGLLKAELLSPALLAKSRIEVRKNQCDFMWTSYVKRLGNAFKDGK